MKNNKKLGLLILATLLLSSCGLKDQISNIEYDNEEKLDFKVEEKKYKEIVEKDEKMKDLDKEEEERIKQKEEQKKKKEEEEKKKKELEKKYLVNTDVLNVRKEAKADGELLGELKQGAEIEALEEVTATDSKVWIKFKTSDGKEAFVLKEFLKKKEESTNTSQSGTDSNQESPKKYKVITDILNVRLGAGETFDVIGSYKENDLIEISDKKTDEQGRQWYMIKFEGKDAYVLSEFLQEQAN